MQIARLLHSFGLRPGETKRSLQGVPAYFADRRQVRAQMLNSETGADFSFGPAYPIFGERNQPAGSASGHYFHQDLHVAQKIAERKPRRHVDVGSRIDGFVAHVATFRQIEVLDLRPLNTHIKNIDFLQCDLMDPFSVEENSTDSLSCLHAIEHFGLGRYGDQIDLDGWKTGLASLTKMLERKGTLYLSVPTSEHQRIEFNAHRVFSIPYLRRTHEQDFHIEDLSFIDDGGGFIPNVDPRSESAERSFGAKYGCSVWTLSKR